MVSLQSSRLIPVPAVPTVPVADIAREDSQLTARDLRLATRQSAASRTQESEDERRKLVMDSSLQDAPSSIVQPAPANNVVPRTKIVVQSVNKGKTADPIMSYVRRRVAAAATKAIEERIARTHIAGADSEVDTITRKEAMPSIHKARWLEAGLNELRGMLRREVWEEGILSSLPKRTCI